MSLLLDDPSDCPYCGKHLMWGGMGWVPHTDMYHAFWYRYWLKRLELAMERHWLYRYLTEEAK